MTAPGRGGDPRSTRAQSTYGEINKPRAVLGQSPFGDAGERLWRSVMDGFELDEHELTLLRSACATADHVEALDALVRSEGAVIESPQGRKAHPALVEVRQQRITLARLLAALRMPQGDEDEGARRPQRRGVRGVQMIGGRS